MKKLFTLFFISTLFISCSQDNDVADMEQEALSFEQKLAKGDFDNSNLGIYKGLFTTLDGQSRATIYITLNGISEPSVEFTFPDFTKAVVRSSAKTIKGQAVKGMDFNEGEFDFTFKVNADGTNPVIENATYKGQKGDVILLKETSKAPVETKTGTYTCETGCFGASPSEDPIPHPELGAPGATQTFSYMLSDASIGNSIINVQYVLNSKAYVGTARQLNCKNFDGPGDYQTCGMFTTNATGDVTFSGRSGPVRFRSATSETTSQGRHVYRKDGDAYQCSSYYGIAYYDSTIFGVSSLAFSTDDDTTVSGGDCFDFTL